MKHWNVYNMDNKVADLYYDENKDLFSMDIIDTGRWQDMLPKVFFTDKMVRDWIERRLTPEYQGGYDDFLRRAEEFTGMKFDKSDRNYRIKLFFALKGANAKDEIWVTDKDNVTYEDSPHYDL